MVNTMADMTRTESPGEFEVGTRVDVRSRYVGAWSRGFEIAERLDDGVRVRRMSDGSLLPDVFDLDDIRPEKRKQGMWWY
jgi:hypothetical protein